jgi:putative acetyltransferase
VEVGVSAEFIIRTVTPDDSEPARRLVHDVLREFGFTPAPETTDSDLEDVEASYLRAGGSFHVAVDGAGRIVGTVGLFRLDARRCELRKMYLAADCRGKGLGKRLLQAAINRARELGFRRIELDSHSSLRTAARLYESFGFRPRAPEHVSVRSDRAYSLDLDQRK